MLMGDDFRSRSESGYTLVELLMVVVVIGILATIAIPIFANRRESALRAAVHSDLRNAATHFEAAAASNDGQYPLAIPAAVRPSPQVTITLGGSASVSRICLKGDHAQLLTSTYYDSLAGGVTAAAC